MTCHDALDRAGGYARGTLPPAERARVEQHLASCPACAAAAARLATLSPAIEPPPDLWPVIAQRIDAQKVVVAAFGASPPAPRWRRPAALVAAALAFLALGSALTTFWAGRPQGGAASAGAPGADFATLEVQYQSAAEDILRAVRSGDVALSPWTIAVLERNVRIINDAIAESRDALARDPGNIALREMVLGTYRQKLDLLRRATAARL
jgi:anti-sigma factor RsiW